MIWKYIPTPIKKWLAESFGYFWKPCPICGKFFAGFEVNGHNGYLINRATMNLDCADLTCSDPACKAEAERRNKRFITYLKGGVTFFVDEVEGDDSNDGLTPGTPLKTQHMAITRIRERLDNAQNHTP